MALQYMLVFFAIGGGAFVSQLAQSYAWTVCAERLIRRLRSDCCSARLVDSLIPGCG